jgi:hypothetical protein
MSSLSEKIKKGLEEFLEYTQGKRTLRTKLIELSEPPSENVEFSPSSNIERGIAHLSELPASRAFPSRGTWYVIVATIWAANFLVIRIFMQRARKSVRR